MYVRTLAAAAAALLCAGLACAADENNSASDESLDRFRHRVEKIAAEHHVRAPSAEDLGLSGAGQPAQNKEAWEAPDSPLAKAAAKASPIERIVDMGISKVRAVKGRDGSLMFIADMGRFAFTGSVYDLWQKKKLSSIEEIADAVSRMNLSGLNIRPEDLNLARTGTGAKHVMIFVDPLCGWCHKLMNEVAADPAIRSEYTFDFLVIPALGQPSADLAKRLYCSEQNPGKRFDALREGRAGIERLPQAAASCNAEGNQRTQMTSAFLGIHAVPFVIAPDGRFSRGKPADLRRFLEGAASDGGKEEAPRR